MEVNGSSEEGKGQSERREEEGTWNGKTVRTRANEGASS